MKSKNLGRVSAGLLAAGLLAGLVSSTVSAATIVGSCGPTATSGIGIVDAFADCQPFDPSLGTLTGITYSVSVQYSGSFVFVNYGDAEGIRTAGTAEMLIMLFHDFLGDQYIDAFETINTPEATLKPGEQLVVPYSSTVTASGGVDPLVHPEFLFPFALLGEVGVMGFPLPIGDCFFPNPVGVCILEEEPFINVTTSGSFTYTYEPFDVPVPEPGTLGLIGLGLAGLGLGRRRKRD